MNASTESRPTLFDSIKKALFPGAGEVTRSDYAASYESAPSFTDMLPWVEYLSKSKQFLFSDGLSRMAVFEIDPVPTEGRSQESLLESMQSLIQVFSDSFPEMDKDPWVIQVFASSESDIFHHLERLRSYINPEINKTTFTKRFLSYYEEHLRDVSRPQGYFYDEEVLDAVWRGQSSKIRLVCYRRYWSTKPSEPAEVELDQVCSKLQINLDSLGVGVRRLDGRGFYEWMLNWLNPRPEICDGDPTKLRDVAPYPGDDNIPVGRDFAEMVTLSRPTIDQKNKLWYLDGLPHIVVQVLNLLARPRRGQLTGELLHAGKVYSLADRLPEGSVISMTTTIMPQDSTANGITLIEDRAIGAVSESILARQEARLVLERMSSGDKLYPCEVAIYLRGENPLELRKNVNRVRSLLSQHSISTIDPWKDAIQITNFKRNLPGVFVPELDKKASRRSRFMFVSDQASMAPVYGRSRGTSNPGILAFNRNAEPLSFDPLCQKDRQKNAHMLVIGPTGSGKSATLNWIMSSMMAVHRPRIFIIEAGNSFSLLGEYFKKHGISVNNIRLTMNSNVAIPPFADVLSLLEKKDRVSIGGFDDKDHDIEEDLKQFDSDDEEGFARDIIGEAEIIARLMITGGEAEAEKQLTRSKRMVIRKAIMLAAENVQQGKTKSKTVLPEDVAAAIIEIAKTEEYRDSMRELREMSDSMLMFCSGLNGHLFNREGELWPEADVTIVDLADAAATGREDTLSVAYVSLIQHINGLVERDQNEARDTIVLTDEGHLITTNPLLSPYIIKITKMWRKLGCWFWIATQNLEDFPDSARRMLNMMEFWIALTMPKDEVDQTSRFKQLTEEQKHMMMQCVKVPGKYVEAVVLSDKLKTLMRIVPPSIAFALSLTEKHEKAARQKIIREGGAKDHCEAAEVVAQNIRKERLSSVLERGH